MLLTDNKKKIRIPTRIVVNLPTLLFQLDANISDVFRKFERIDSRPLKSSSYLNIICNKAKLHQLLRHQKHASRIIFFTGKQTHAKPLLQSINAQLPVKYISYLIIHAQGKK